MRKPAAAFVVIGVLATLTACRRTLPARDAASDGAPSVGDGGRSDVPGADGAGDGGLAICPAGVRALSVCGCGCCSGVAEGTACYYPSLGQTREAIPNPGPSDPSCTLLGCSSGTRYLCCADPGPGSAQVAICANDTSIEDLARFTITRRDGAVCTTLEVGSAAPLLPIPGPPGRTNVSAWRAPCDGSGTRQVAIGGLGNVSPSASSGYDVHVALFFDAGTGSADAVRIDKDGVEVARLCASAVCPPCAAACELDGTYRFTTTGGLGAFRDGTILAPPASYTRVRKPEALPGTEKSCTPPFPSCGGAAVDVGDVMAALADPDVKDAFARSTGAVTLPFYGVDERGGDGVAFQITRDGGGGFLIGGPCSDAPTAPCTPIPPGLSRLLTTLVALDQQQTTDPSCDFTLP